MCFGGGGGGSSKQKNPAPIPAPEPAPAPIPENTTQPKRRKFDWWTPPDLAKPILSLNPEATGQPQTLRDLRNTGRSRLTIPVDRAGLGIPR